MPGLLRRWYPHCLSHSAVTLCAPSQTHKKIKQCDGLQWLMGPFRAILEPCLTGQTGQSWVCLLARGSSFQFYPFVPTSTASSDATVTKCDVSGARGFQASQEEVKHDADWQACHHDPCRGKTAPLTSLALAMGAWLATMGAHCRTL